MKTKRRIEITVFRRQRLATADVVPEQPVPPSTTVEDERLIADVLALVKQLTGESPGSAIKVVRQKDATDEVKASGCDTER